MSHKNGDHTSMGIHSLAKDRKVEATLDCSNFTTLSKYAALLNSTMLISSQCLLFDPNMLFTFPNWLLRARRRQSQPQQFLTLSTRPSQRFSHPADRKEIQNEFHRICTIGYPLYFSLVAVMAEEPMRVLVLAPPIYAHFLYLCLI